MQWHQIFAHLLRPLVQGYSDVQTEVRVGGLFREADLLLLLLTAPAPFVGIWRHLTLWNTMEFKGPTDDPALRDLDLLLEVGLGIDRRLNEERRRQGQPELARSEMSWWYLANHVGRRFRAEVERVLGTILEPLEPGLWRCMAVGRVLLVVSRDELAVELDSVPLHLVTRESAAQSQAVTAEVVRQPGCWHS